MRPVSDFFKHEMETDSGLVLDLAMLHTQTGDCLQSRLGWKQDRLKTQLGCRDSLLILSYAIHCSVENKTFTQSVKLIHSIYFLSTP